MSTSMTKRAFDTMAIVSMAHLAALVFGVAYLVYCGALSGSNVRLIAAVMRGEQLVPAPPEEEAQTEGAAAPAYEAGQSAQDAAERTQVEDEIARREAERTMTELDQRLATVNRELLLLTKEREAFQREQEEAAELAQQVAQAQDTTGFAKELAYFESLSPKVAVQHLLAKSDVDEAARILLAIDTGKGKKIIEAAKRGTDLQQMKLILQRLTEVAPQRAGELSQGANP